jgi:NAD(P)-dependent dehydrogenase (short-subunit alcohol dehydrogenase family)
MTPENKVAFIPGASRGLALQTACELGRRCILVPIGSRGPEARKAAESLRCDVTKPEDRRAVRDHFERRCGKLDMNRSKIVSSREPGRNLRGESLRFAVGQSPD